MFHAVPRSAVLVTMTRSRPSWQMSSSQITLNRLVSSSRRRLLPRSVSLPSTSNPSASRNVHTKESSLQDGQESVILLYQRDPERNSLPRSAFLFSSLNSLYWIWYVFDFVPAVNSSPVPELHVDPAFGFAGLGLSVLMQSMFTLYPLSLVSKMAYDPVTQHVWLWKHSLPWVRPSPKALPPIPLGDITMDKTSSDTKKILTDLGGDVQKYQGHLGLSVANSYIPFLVEIRAPHEVHNSQLFLEALLDPQRLKHQRTPNRSNKTISRKGQPSQLAKTRGKATKESLSRNR